MTKKEFGALLKSIRESRGLSVKNLSESTSVTKSAIRNLEKGIFYPRPQTLFKLCKGLNEDYEVLFELIKEKK